jgi:hypothetical protein
LSRLSRLSRLGRLGHLTQWVWLKSFSSKMD